jgi:hypothetical protein
LRADAESGAAELGRETAAGAPRPLWSDEAEAEVEVEAEATAVLCIVCDDEERAECTVEDATDG